MTNSMLGTKIVSILDKLAECSEEGQGVTRLFCSKEHKAAHKLLQKWMCQAGLQAHIDDAGNSVGLYKSKNPNAKTLVVGSHQDSVLNAGKYDGTLGIMLPVICLEDMINKGIELPFNVMVVGFGDEEGTRFQTTLIGSRALAGTFDKANLEKTDAKGISLHKAMADFGLNPDRLDKIALNANELIGFVEVHIEQGPQLEDANLPVGVVSAITSIERHNVTFEGLANHAGTTPMNRRQNALLAAADCIRAVDNILSADPELVGVIGKLDVFPNAVNVIPAKACLTIELRSPDTNKRLAARKDILKAVEDCATKTNTTVNHSLTYEQTGTGTCPELTNALAKSIKANGLEVKTLYSGAGHDALAMAELTDVAMLFVRCTGGLSHHPEEHITAQDADIAAKTFIRFLQDLKS